MIRSGLLAVLLVMPAAARAAEGEAPAPVAPLPGAPVPDDTLQRFRTPLDALTERTLGSASRAVRFDWRNTRVGFGVVASHLLELNNFSTSRIGAFARTSVGPFMGELAFNGAFTVGSLSSERLALTPFRQVGRPSRLELDLNLGYPLVEGVATPRFKFIPALEFVFSVDVGLRYLYYLGSLANMKAGDVALALFAPRLSAKEIENLKLATLPSMQVDVNRYSVMAGISLDVYFQPGFFFSPRAMFSPPLLSAGTASLGWWWELSFRAGFAL